MSSSNEHASRYKDLLELSGTIEDLLVCRNLRGMQTLQRTLEAGYCLRTAQKLLACDDQILIATGFPVGNTQETDGPAGAIALSDALQTLEKSVQIVCEDPLASLLATQHPVTRLATDHNDCTASLQKLSPGLIIAIERPGAAADGNYYNMRGEQISDRVAPIDTYFSGFCGDKLAIGDGGNEVGMGRAASSLALLDIVPAATSCDELLVADVSNWGCFGIIAMLEALTAQPLLQDIRHVEVLNWLAAQGIVDGVTRQAEPTEDGFSAEASQELLDELKRLLNIFFNIT